jgi:ATP-dependent helicase HrpB
MLRVAKISRASAAQRAGRAGRTAPGRCLRLYTKHDHDTRPEHELPEIRRLDLAETVLALRAAGVQDVAGFGWLDPPEPSAVEHAESLLIRLGALDQKAQITQLGRRMLRFPLHPRQARIVCEAEARGVAAEGCEVAALLGERGIRGGGGGRSDLLAALEDLNTRSKIERPFKQLLRLCDAQRKAAPAAAEEATLVSILAGYPDRVARRRAPRSRDVVLASGGGARLSDASVVREAELMVAIDAEEKREAGRAGAQLVVHTASAVEVEWLADLFSDSLRESDELRWNPQTERVESVRRVLYDQLVLEERTGPPGDADAAARMLGDAARAKGIGTLWDAQEIDRLAARLEFGGLSVDVAAALDELCRGRRSLSELRDASLTGAMLDRLEGKQRALLDRLAPDRINLPGGRSTRIHYERGQAPSLASRLQDFFGMADGPRVGNGVPVVLHLLAPNQRAVQVTTDLAGFWARHYPQIRRELMRRYPKHAWPEDPLTAKPPASGRGGSRRT